MSNALVVRRRGPLVAQREALRQRLEAHRARLERAKARVREAFSIRDTIRKHPWTFIAGSVLIGFTLARLTTSRRF